MNYISDDTPKILKDFLLYLDTVKNRSPRTIHEYYLDIRLFLRFILQERKISNEPFNQILIKDVDLTLLKSITLLDAFNYSLFLAHERSYNNIKNDERQGLSAAARARKLSAIKTFYNYLSTKRHLIEVNPLAELELPKQQERLPVFLTLEESIKLLQAIQGNYKERDYCIIMLLLNCGLRVSELCNLNLSDIQGTTLTVIGKGNKERKLHLNDACIDSINEYLPRRIPSTSNALFTSRHAKRIGRATVENMVKKYIRLAGLDEKKYSTHKLRHTAATLMYQNGVDIRTLQDVLGHEHLDTTQIYTHVVDDNIKNASLQHPLAKIKESDL